MAPGVSILAPTKRDGIFEPAQVARQAECFISDGAMVANLESTRLCRLIVLVTNRAVVREMEFLAPPNLMFFRRASF